MSIRVVAIVFAKIDINVTDDLASRIPLVTGVVDVLVRHAAKRLDFAPATYLFLVVSRNWCQGATRLTTFSVITLRNIATCSFINLRPLLD